MLIVMNKSTHTEHLYEPLQTNNKQFKITITFLVIMVFSILQVKIINFISQNESSMIIIFRILLFQKVLSKSKT